MSSFVIGVLIGSRVIWIITQIEEGVIHLYQNTLANVNLVPQGFSGEATLPHLENVFKNLVYEELAGRFKWP